MVKLACDRLSQLAAYLPVMAQGLQVKARDRMPNGPNIAREALQTGRTPVPSTASGAKDGATWLGKCATPAKTLNQSGGN